MTLSRAPAENQWDKSTGWRMPFAGHSSINCGPTPQLEACGGKNNAGGFVLFALTCFFALREFIRAYGEGYSRASPLGRVAECDTITELKGFY